MKIIYRIRRSDGKWSRAGWVVKDKECGWTDKIDRAKVWKRTSDLNNHLTSVRDYCKRYPHAVIGVPSDWEVVVFEIKEVEKRSIPLTKLRFE